MGNAIETKHHGPDQQWYKDHLTGVRGGEQQLLYPNADITPSQQPMQGMGSESRGLREYPIFAHFRAAAGLER